MSTEQPYIIIRRNNDGNFYTVHSTVKIKDARYWLQYIAQAGDAIFMTSSHEKYTGSGKPVYQAHLVERGKIEYDETLWKRQVDPEGTTEIPAHVPPASA